MNNNLEFENEDPSPDSIEDNHPRTNYGEGYGGKETLEEAAEKLSKNAYKKHSVKDDKLSLDEQIQRSGGFIVGFKEGMIVGAKWQQERSYSEEEVKQFAFECVANFLSNDDNKVEIKLVDVIIDRLNNKFEQFKKK